MREHFGGRKPVLSFLLASSERALKLLRKWIQSDHLGSDIRDLQVSPNLLHCVVSEARARFPRPTGVCPMHQNAVLLYNLQSTYNTFLHIISTPFLKSSCIADTFERWFAVVCRWLMIWEPPPSLLGHACHFWSIWKCDLEVCSHKLMLLSRICLMLTKVL